jgi:hypothetical protein
MRTMSIFLKQNKFLLFLHRIYLSVSSSTDVLGFSEMLLLLINLIDSFQLKHVFYC